MFGALALATGQHDERMIGWRQPRLGVQNHRTPRFAFGDQDAVQPDVHYANAMRQPPDFDRNAAGVTVAALHLYGQLRSAAGVQRDCILVRGGQQITGVVQTRHAAD